MNEALEASKPEDKPGFFVRATRGHEYEDFGRDASGEGIHWTLAQCKAWLKANTVNGTIEANDGGEPFACTIIHWA